MLAYLDQSLTNNLLIIHVSDYLLSDSSICCIHSVRFFRMALIGSPVDSEAAENSSNANLKASLKNSSQSFICILLGSPSSFKSINNKADILTLTALKIVGSG